MVIVTCTNTECAEYGIEKRGIPNGLDTLCGECLQLCQTDTRPEPEVDNADPAN